MTKYKNIDRLIYDISSNLEITKKKINLVVEPKNNNKIIIDFDFNLSNLLDILNIKEDYKDINITFKDIIFLCRFDITNVHLKINSLIIKNVEFDKNIFLFYNTISYFEIQNIYIKSSFTIVNTQIDMLIISRINFGSNNTSLNILYDKGIENNINYISFSSNILHGVVNIKNVKSRTCDLSNIVLLDAVINPINFEVEKFANRESALLLKQQAIINNNTIDALKYHALEVEKHKEDLKDKWVENKNLKTAGDIISIQLSSLFSDNGINWIKALMMTLLFPTIFFSLSYNLNYLDILIFIFLCLLNIFIFFKKIKKYLCIFTVLYIVFYFLKIDFSIDYITDLLQFLIPTNFNQIVDNDKTSYIFKDQNILNIIVKAISYFLGKVAFWYGSFHTVAAFRKFNRSI